MNTLEPMPQSSDSSSACTSDERELEILGRCLDDLGGAADKAAVVADYCARYPDLADKIRDLAHVGQVLGDTTSWGDVPPGDEEQGGSATSDSAPHPSRFGPYRVLRSIGRGGMGEVYEAEEEVLHRRVAVKTIRRSKATDPGLLERFDRERQVLARLHDTHIVPIFATGQEGDLLYFAMPYIPGVALNQFIRTAQRHSHDAANSPLPSFEALVNEARSKTTSAAKPDVEQPGPDRATADPPPSAGASTSGNGRTSLPLPYLRAVVATMADAAEALHHAHEDAIIHRDVKPSNIMVEPSGQTWVLDFGLAHLRKGAAGHDSNDGHAGAADNPPPDPVADSEPVHPESRSLTAGTLGTIPYMAPEQIWNGHGQAQASDTNTDPDLKIDARTDVWGLGATLYELLTLHRAFKDRDQIIHAEPARPRTHVPDLPRDLEAVCLKALNKDPEHRYPTARGLAEDLRHWLNHEPTKARPARTARRLALWSRRNKGWATAIVVAGVLLFTLGAGGLLFGYVQAEAEKNQRRESLILQHQHLRLTSHPEGW